MSTPDLSPAQIVAVIGALCAQLVDATLIDGRLSKLIVGLAGIIIPLAWMLADSIIRHGRAQVAAAAIASGHPLVK